MEQVLCICKKCGRKETTPVGKVPGQETDCVTEFALHDWQPVQVEEK
jgi:hypothetical protein